MPEMQNQKMRRIHVSEIAGNLLGFLSSIVCLAKKIAIDVSIKSANLEL